MHVIEDMYRRGQVDKDTIAQLKSNHTLSEHDVLRAKLYSRTDPLVRAVRSLSPEQALNVYQVATDKEKKELRSLIEAKSRELNTKINDPVQRQELKDAFRKALHPAQPKAPAGNAV